MLVSTGKGLAAHLDVPLPYLLFRAQARYEEDLRGLQGIRGPVNPFAGPSAAKPGELFPAINDTPTAPRRLSGGLANSVRMASSTRQQTPLGVRGRLNSLGGPKKATSSSTLTLRAPLRKPRAALEPPSPSSSGSGESDTDEEATKAERAEKEHEMQEDLERKLQNLQLLMTNEALGFVRSAPRTGGSSILNGSKGKGLDRGRAAVPAYGTTSTRTPLSDSLRLGGLGLTPLATQQRPGPESTRSQSVSSASSPQGSIPSIPSPQSESQRTSPISIARPAKSSSPPALSPRSSRSVRYQALVGRTNISEQGSNHGSSASSFSDISGKCSLIVADASADTDPSGADRYESLIVGAGKRTLIEHTQRRFSDVSIPTPTDTAAY